MGVVADERGIARTYSHPSVADPYDVVDQYRRAMRYGSDAGSTRVARELGVPRSRVRPWLDGATPDAVRAIETASEFGWLADEWTATTEALARLVAGVFACGSIQTTAMRPSWTPATATGRSRLETALDAVGVGVTLEDDDRTPELWPETHPSLLGRTLVASGAPIGSKTPSSVTALPRWVHEAPRPIRVGFAQLLVSERGIEYADKQTRRIQSSRSPSYFREVAALVRSVSGEAASYSDSGVTISADAVRALELA